MSTETETPRTDAAICCGPVCVPVEFARTLERELSDAIRTLSGHQPELCDEIRLERDHLRRELDAAKAAHTDEYWNAMASGGVLEDVKHQLSDAHARESLLKTRLWKSEGYVRVLEARESRLREALEKADKMAGGRWTEWGGRAEMVRDIIRAALAEPPSVPSVKCALEWLPIESAPKDGRSVILWDGGVNVGFWSTCTWVTRMEGSPLGKKDGAWVIYECRSDTVELEATHWMPIPQGPRTAESQPSTGAGNES